MKSKLSLLAVFCLIGIFPMAKAQFSFNGQYIVRGEYRNGFQRPIESDQKPAFFLAHRARIQAEYQHQDFSFFMSVQDVRTWGSTSQLNVSDGFLSVHEAWGLVNFNPKWSLKVGRQELNYDNFRFLGNVDWALQARSHDLALLRFENESSKLHFGAAFNQQIPRLSETTYEQPNQYKTAQFVRYEKGSGAVPYSLLFWNEGRENAGKVFFRQTFGLSNFQFGSPKKLKTSGFAYMQTGENFDQLPISGWNVGVDLKKEFTLDSAKNKKLEFALGGEILSGSKNGEEKDRSFLPQYGTNHLFNGFMDYFYVGGPYEESVGLQDLYLKGRFTPNPKSWIQADYHFFWTQQSLASGADNYLGSELDLSFGLIINEAVSLQGGYSAFFATESFTELTQVSNPKNNQDWAYIMLIFRPNNKNRFIGVRI
ncbi:MAG: alginate export family protein [Algoriphagus sp.]|nr:alginate export family protein [Algoriphagus sp.]